MSLINGSLSWMKYVVNAMFIGLNAIFIDVNVRFIVLNEIFTVVNIAVNINIMCHQCNVYYREYNHQCLNVKFDVLNVNVRISISNLVMNILILYKGSEQLAMVMNTAIIVQHTFLLRTFRWYSTGHYDNTIIH